MSDLVLYGAGACGGYVLKHLRSKGIEPASIVDSDQRKWGSDFNGVMIFSPEDATAEYPDAEWVATAISRPAATEIRAILAQMGVKTKPLWECLDVCHGLPSTETMADLIRLASDIETHCEIVSQFTFRSQPDYDYQRPPSDSKDIYFPDFIQHRDDEHFVDCGAADGDTVREFRKRWSNYSQIRAFEPDRENYWALAASALDDERNHGVQAAVSDFTGRVMFTAAGDYSSHLGGDNANAETNVYRLDDVL